MNILKITHNAGFFSCFSKRLEGTVWYFNKYKCLPDSVDSTEQFSLFKSNPSDNLIPLYFKENNRTIKYTRKVYFHNDDQFSDYKKLDFEGLLPFIDKYFTPSDVVMDVVALYEKKYAIDYKNTCAVFYRGNDKFTETNVASYESFISKARVFKKEHPNIKFLVQTDETEFLEAFLREFPGSTTFQETPSMSKIKSTIHDQLPVEDRTEHGKTFFAAILALSKCNSIITHSGNGSLWCVLYRGNCENVYQDFNNSWNYGFSLYSMWYAYKRYIKSLFKKHSYWSVLKF